MKGEEFHTYLEENDGVVSFQIPEGFENQVRIVCTDCAVHSDGTTNTYDETFARITVSANQFVIFFANRTAFGLTAAAAVAAIGTTAALILRKKSRKKENSKV
jgi:dihydrodipicolinate reductase